MSASALPTQGGAPPAKEWLKPRIAVIREALAPHFKYWAVWNPVWRDGRWTKPPSDPLTGRYLKPNEPETWADFATCAAKVEAGKFVGLGVLMVAGSGITGFDVDDAEETLAKFPDVARAIKAYIGRGGYCEVSPSGQGLRLFAKGAPPTQGSKRNKLEVYADLRFLTATGHGGGMVIDEHA